MSVNDLANYLAKLQSNEEGHRTELITGEVTSLSPLTVRFGELNVTSPFLLLSKIARVEYVGQRVLAIKSNAGQQYYVLHEHDIAENVDYETLIDELRSELYSQLDVVNQELAARAPLVHSHTWAQITDAPSTFPPSAHTHAWADITSPPTTATRWPAWSEVTGKPTTFTPSAHTHDHITVPDNRSVVSVPSDLEGFAISADFKTNASAGSPPVTASPSYTHLINVAGYSSDQGSGGWPSQISVGDGLAVRQGTGVSSWGPWRKVWHDGNDGSGSGLDADLIKGKHFIVADQFNAFASPDDVTANAMAYVLGTTGILGRADGALYSQSYSPIWVHQIYGDYRTGRIAVRGNSNNVWQPWLKIPVESDIYDDSESYRLLKGKGGYIRTPLGGILPYSQSNSSYVGTSDWPFSRVYASTIYEGGTALINKYASASQIGNLASLTTTHKSTLVGAVNELHGDSRLLTYRGYLSDLSDASIIGAQSGYYHLGAATTNVGGFDIYAPILILRRYGDYGNALVIGLNSTRTALTFRMVFDS